MQKIIPFHTDEYGDEPEVCVSAPGRFHLLGEHTWFAEGNTLSMAIDHYLYLCLSKRADNNFRFYSVSLDERKKISNAALKYRKEDRWANSSKAVISAFMDAGIEISGLNFTILSEIPADAGLGTPNALKIATAMALKKLFAPKLTKANVGSILEHANVTHLNTYPHRADILCGLFSKTNHCIKTSHKTKNIDFYPFPIKGNTIIIIDSRVPKTAAREELTDKLEECINAYELIKFKHGSPKDINGITEHMLDEISIPEPVRRRMSCIIKESSYVNDAAESLVKNDLLAFSRILLRSHEGLRDKLEISCPELDWIIKRAVEFIDPAGNNFVTGRMTGKGFGGCAYIILKNEDANNFIEKISDYERIFGFKPLIYKVKPSYGAKIVI